MASTVEILFGALSFILAFHDHLVQIFGVKSIDLNEKILR